MEITYIGHSSFKIKSKNITLVTDPYDPTMLGIKFPKVAADIVTISHDHPDHNKADLVSMGVTETKKILNGPGEYEIGGISIIGLPTFHDNKKGELRGKNIVYLFEVEDYRIVHLGDLGHKLADSEIEDLGHVDILMVPVGGHFTIGPSEAVEMVGALEPKIIIPMHYNDPVMNQETFSELARVETFLAAIGTTVETVDKLILKGPIIDEQKVVKLSPSHA